jgi:hypothetical protein
MNIEPERLSVATRGNQGLLFQKKKKQKAFDCRASAFPLSLGPDS